MRLVSLPLTTAFLLTGSPFNILPSSLAVTSPATAPIDLAAKRLYNSSPYPVETRLIASRPIQRSAERSRRSPSTDRLPTPDSRLPTALAQQSCSPPALSRVTRHRVAAGETLDSIARRYNLLPTTLIGFNPALRTGKVTVGTEIFIPPFNGIRVDVKAGQTIRDVAKAYGVRPDVLFEANGCQTAPKALFIPGVNWSPVGTSKPGSLPESRQILSGSPFAAPLSESSILQRYGYGVQGNNSQVAFHSGIDLVAPVGTPVLAVGDGTIAFASQQGAYGNLVVINHLEGLQTRYGQLGSMRVKAGQTVKRGQVIGTVGTSGRPTSSTPHLHFEVRSRSSLGWVAKDPAAMLKLQVQQQGGVGERK